ncbi:MAG: DUF1961 family protein [Victivallaceae bacterium]
MKKKTVEELEEFKIKQETAYRNTSKGKQKIWGKQIFSPLIQAHGEIIFSDNFDNLKNWHHEGGGTLTQPNKNILQLNCIGARQGGIGCMAFCRKNFPDNICIEYDMKVVFSKGLVITFVAAQGREDEDIITELPLREGIFTDYTHNPNMRSYHVSISRYNDKGEHTGTSNWRRNPGLFMMAQQNDLCEKINTWYHIAIIKKGSWLQLAVDGKLAGGFVDSNEIPEPIPSTGKIGYRAIGSEVIAQIKNFKVTSLNEINNTSGKMK